MPFNMSKKKEEMPQRSPEERIKDFQEVELGLQEESLLREADRCLECKVPTCVPGCPVGIDIPGFIKLIKERRYIESAQHIKRFHDFPAICGRVCQQEKQCELNCIRKKNGEPVAIGRLERFVGDVAIQNKVKRCDVRPRSKKKVAVVGSGPSGLSCAGHLSALGHEVVIFESLHKAGGVLVYGIPEFRLPKNSVQAEIDALLCGGVTLKTDTVIGKMFSIEQLLRDFDAIFLGCGAGLPNFMRIPGENLIGVYSANEYLTRNNLMKAYLFPVHVTPIKKAKKVIVVGGGNTAMDSARVARRYGSEVTVVYRRSEHELPAREEEFHHAKQEGISFLFLTAPHSVLGSEKVQGIRCIRMELGEQDASGRKIPLPIEGSEFDIECDIVIVAIGQGPNPLISDGFSFTKDKKGKIIVDEHLRTSHSKIFAAGDIASCSTGEGTVIKAMGDGKRAAYEIDAMMRTADSHTASRK